jgi:hypothetical protein
MSLWKHTLIRLAPFLLSGATFFISGCASKGGSYAIEFFEEVQVSENGGNPVPHKAGEKLWLDTNSYALVSAPGQKSILIPPRENSATVQLHVSALGSEVSQNEHRPRWVSLDTLVSEANHIQVLLSRRETKEALAKADETIKNNPEISLFWLLKTNCLIVLGDTKGAKATLSEMLVHFPDNQEAAVLRQSLTKSGKL